MLTSGEGAGGSLGVSSALAGFWSGSLRGFFGFAGFWSRSRCLRWGFLRFAGFRGREQELPLEVLSALLTSGEGAGTSLGASALAALAPFLAGLAALPSFTGLSAGAASLGGSGTGDSGVGGSLSGWWLVLLKTQ